MFTTTVSKTGVQTFVQKWLKTDDTSSRADDLYVIFSNMINSCKKKVYDSDGKYFGEAVSMTKFYELFSEIFVPRENMTKTECDTKNEERVTQGQVTQGQEVNQNEVTQDQEFVKVECLNATPQLKTWYREDLPTHSPMPFNYHKFTGYELKNGRLHGVGKIFNLDGDLLKEGTFNEGRLVTV